MDNDSPLSMVKEAEAAFLQAAHQVYTIFEKNVDSAVFLRLGLFLDHPQDNPYLGPRRVAIRRFFLFLMPTLKATYLIDGFNLYHSVRKAQRSI